MDGTEPSLETEEGGGLAASPFFALQIQISDQFVLGFLGLASNEEILIVSGEVEPIYLLLSLSDGSQSAPGFCRQVYLDGSFGPDLR